MHYHPPLARDDVRQVAHFTLWDILERLPKRGIWHKVNVGRTTINVLNDFNPYTTTPVEGVDWEKDEDFGDPSTDGSYQNPRNYRFSVGICF